MGGFRGSVPSAGNPGFGNSGAVPPRPVTSAGHSRAGDISRWEAQYGGRANQGSLNPIPQGPNSQSGPIYPGGPRGGISPSNLSEWQAAMQQRPGMPRPVAPTASPGHSRANDIAAAREAQGGWDSQYGGQLNPDGSRRDSTFTPAVQPPTSPTQPQLPLNPGAPNGGLSSPVASSYGSRLAPSPQYSSMNQPSAGTAMNPAMGGGQETGQMSPQLAQAQALRDYQQAQTARTAQPAPAGA